MAKYIVRRSYVIILGRLWMPQCMASMYKVLSPYDVENIRAEGDGEIAREAIEQWLTANSGDFSSVVDFVASIEDGEETRYFEWTTEENEIAYLDTLPAEE